MEIQIQQSEQMLTWHEKRAKKIRKIWGSNTIVWFQRKAHYALYGYDADVTEKILGDSFEHQVVNDEFVAYLPKIHYEYKTAALVSAGLKICILND